MTGMLFLVDNAERQMMFSVESVSGTQQISLYDAGDGNHILFLPSYAELEKVRVASNVRKGIVIGDTAMTEGASCAGFALDKPYALTINGKNAGTIRFCRSANVATMFIDTASGNMIRIHEDKNYRETASIKLYTSDGILDHADTYASLKGRGNATWSYAKKPYALMLSSPGDILDMGAATNWILLANSLDDTNLHNKLVYDFGKQAGFFWTPDCEYVDVWLNGEYNGLYLLTEKVEVHPERLAIDVAADDFLCKIEFDVRWDRLRNPFRTISGRTIEITAPEVLQAEDQQRINESVNELDRVILSGDHSLSTEIFDLDSWVRKYLIDEIFCNLDADMGSSYFYNKDDVFYAGPLWDYDMTFDNSISTENPNAFYAKFYEKYGGYTSQYYAALYANDLFLQRVKEIYQLEYLPILRNMIDTEIESLYTKVEKAIQMNRIRWSGYSVDSPEICISPTDELRSYLERRIEFLSNAWVNGKKYCTIHIKYSEEEGQRYISVEEGARLDADRVELEGARWLDYSTGEVFDFSKPILKDMILVKDVEDLEGHEPLITSSRDYITILSIVTLVGILSVFMLIDHRRRKERRRADARTKVST